MNEAKRSVLLGALKLFDLGLLTLSYGLATLFVLAPHGPRLAEFLSIRVKLGNLALFSFLILMWHCVLWFCGMYGSKRLSNRRAEIVDMCKSTTLCVASLVLLAYVFSITMVTSRFLLLFWCLSFFFLACGRLLLRVFLSSVRRGGRNLRNIVILGTNDRAIEFAHMVEAKPELGYRIVGFVDEKWAGSPHFALTGRSLVADLVTLPDFLRHNVVDEVANYLPLRSFYEGASQIASLCELHGILLRFDSDIFGLKTTRAQVGEFKWDHHITSYPGTLPRGAAGMKRALDFVFALALSCLFSPLLFIIALLLKLSSDGPVFFSQERIGYNKRRFNIYKFRTMVPDAESMIGKLEELNEISGPVFKIKNDPRITPLGKWLRRTSIDELPQIINVLKGDMSLVGPRPLPVRDYAGFNEDWQRRRFSVRPGMTCLWQVSGRNSVAFDQWMKLDLQYVDEWSLWLDFKILARTIPAVFKGSGAS